ncbi:MAG: GNAT family N-acetyltransferase [Firmicutes bacterium]|nr:GNAT family N-acetyltransferase [Bacillota bacterium]
MFIRTYKPDDVEVLVDLINQADAFDHAGRRTNPQEVRAFLAQPGNDPGRSLFLAEIDGKPVGYSELVVRSSRKEKTFLCYGMVLPAFRRRGIGSRLVSCVIDRAKEIGSEGPPPVFQISARQGISGVNALAASLGLKPSECNLRLELDNLGRIPPVGVPAGVMLRAYQPGGDEQEYVALFNLAFAEHWGNQYTTVEEMRYFFAQPGHNPEGQILAFIGGKMAGLCGAITEAGERQRTGRMMGEIDAVAVHPDYRGLGLGRLMVVAGLRYLKRCGMEAAWLSVIGSNHRARAIYESLGFAEKQRTVMWRKMLEVPRKVAVGSWTTSY